MTLRERLARAIAALLYPPDVHDAPSRQWTPQGWVDRGRPVWTDHLPEVDAVIAALRTPPTAWRSPVPLGAPETLASVLRVGETPDASQEGMWVVAAALAHRVYGGPEEGGWWYDTWDPFDDDAMAFARQHNVGQVFSSFEDACCYAALFDEATAAENAAQRRPDKYSVASRGVLDVHIFEGWPTRVPQAPPQFE